MEITWKYIFDLLKRMLELNQREIADYLSVHPSTISNLINGKQPRFRYKINDVYDNLFSPNAPLSPAYNKQPKELLEIIKDDIKEAGLTDAAKNLKNDDYEKFVMGLLHLAKENEPKKSIKEENLPSHVVENEKNDQKDNERQLAQIPTQENLQNINMVAQLNIPPNCKICLCCTKWEGNAQDAYKNIDGVLGKCMFYNNNTLSTDGINCEKFKANYGRIMQYENIQKLNNFKTPYCQPL